MRGVVLYLLVYIRCMDFSGQVTCVIWAWPCLSLRYVVLCIYVSAAYVQLVVGSAVSMVSVWRWFWCDHVCYGTDMYGCCDVCVHPVWVWPGHGEKLYGCVWF